MIVPLDRLCVLVGDICWLAEAVALMDWGSCGFLHSRRPVRIVKAEVNADWGVPGFCVLRVPWQDS